MLWPLKVLKTLKIQVRGSGCSPKKKKKPKKSKYWRKAPQIWNKRLC